MKYLLSIVLAICILGLIYGGRNTSKINEDIDTTTSDTAAQIKEIQQVVSEIINPPQDNDKKYYGDTLYQYDGKTVVYDYFSFNDEDITSRSHSAIITYQDTIPVDTCMVNGNGWWFADGETLKFSIGVDTVYYNFRHLPEAVYPEVELLPKGVKEYFHTNRFALTDSSWDCDFVFRAYLSENSPGWIRQFIATVLNNDIQGLFMDNKGADKILKEYYGIKSNPRKIHGLDASVKTPKEIARHFSKEHERLYRKEFDGPGSDGHGPKYDYSFLMVPAWQSKDGNYVTYRFYTYYYTMGMHGFMEEYYLTFNTSTGKLLGFSDLFKGETAQKVVQELDKYYSKRRKEIGYNFDGIQESWLGEKDLESNMTAILKEQRDSVYYPRPAMTNMGVVFSYQPYEAGPFSEGIIHIILPYKKIESSLKIKL